MNAAILTYEQYRNEERMRRLRAHYLHTLSTRQHVELTQSGEALKREWHARPIPSHKALTVTGVQPARIEPPRDAQVREPRLPATGQQALIPKKRAHRRAGDSK